MTLSFEPIDWFWRVSGVADGELAGGCTGRVILIATLVGIGVRVVAVVKALVGLLLGRIVVALGFAFEPGVRVLLALRRLAESVSLNVAWVLLFPGRVVALILSVIVVLVVFLALVRGSVGVAVLNWGVPVVVGRGAVAVLIAVVGLAAVGGVVGRVLGLRAGTIALLVWWHPVAACGWLSLGVAGRGVTLTATWDFVAGVVVAALGVSRTSRSVWESRCLLVRLHRCFRPIGIAAVGIDTLRLPLASLVLR